MLLDTPLLRDPRNFVSVHFYNPFMFTHQTATWSMPFLAGVIGVPYPAAEGAVDGTLADTRTRFEAINLPAEIRQSQYAEAEKAIRWYFAEEGSLHYRRLDEQAGRMAERAKAFRPIGSFSPNSAP